MKNSNSELKQVIVKRLKQALINTDLSVRLNDPWTIEWRRVPIDIVIYKRTHPLAVIHVEKNLNSLLSIEFSIDMVNSLMKFTNSKFGILTDNDQFLFSYKSKSSFKDLQLSFDEIIEKLKNYEDIEIKKQDKEIVQKLIREAADIHLNENPEFLQFIKGASFLSKIQFDQNTSTYYFSDDDGGITSFENKFFIKMFGEFNDKQICRYTSLNTIFEMLKNLSFRMSGIVGMNDKSEVNYVETYLNNNNLSNILKPLIKEHHNTISAINNRYITSCSTYQRRDDLTLWRLYSDDGKGICLVFDIKKTNLNNHIILQKVRYADKDGNHKELEFLKQIRLDVESNTGFKFEFRKLGYWKHFFKPYDYSIEEEVRLLIIDNDKLQKLNSNWVMTYTHSILNPVIDYRLNSESFPIKLKEIVLGPKCPEQETNFVQLQEMVRRKKREISDGNIPSNLNNLKIEMSKIVHYR